MSVQNITRRAGPYVGTGLVSAFTFAFKVFRSEDVKVLRSASSDADAKDEALKFGTDYAVKLNANQDEKAGGTITLTNPLAEGLRLSILSAITPDQQMVLTNHDGFLPTTLNNTADKAIALIQELKEEIGRSLRVPASADKTPEDLTAELLRAQEEAAQYATQAAESLQRTQVIEQRLTSQEGSLAKELAAEGEKQLQAVQAEGKKQSQAVTAEGNVQVTRIESLFDVAGLSSGMACSRRTIELSADVPAGTEITLPNSQQYVVGRNHLLLFYNDLYVDEAHFSEVGDADTLSSKIKLTFDMKLNADRPNRLTALVIPLGREEVNELVERVKRVEDALADLSRSVAYVQQTK